MKKIINGKKYDTDTAKLVGEYNNGRRWTDFSYLSEKLFLKKTGEFFLFGEGGPMTQYAEWSHGLCCDGSRIMPMTYDDAQQWAEEHFDGDEYEKIFGEVQEDETQVSATFRISASTLETVRRDASAAGLTISDYVERALVAAHESR